MCNLVVPKGPIVLERGRERMMEKGATLKISYRPFVCLFVCLFDFWSVFTERFMRLVTNHCFPTAESHFPMSVRASFGPVLVRNFSKFGYSLCVLRGPGFGHFFGTFFW